ASVASPEPQSTAELQAVARSKPNDSVAPAQHVATQARARDSAAPDSLQVLPSEPNASASRAQSSGSSPNSVAQPAAMADAAQLEELERQMDQLSSRTASVNDSLNRMRQQQAASGLGLRGDVASSQERMATYLAKAEAA